MVSDEVWAQLDHRAGRRPRVATVRLLVTGALVALLLLGGSMLWRSGLVAAQLGWSPLAGWSTEGGPGSPLRQEVVIANRGWVAVTLIAAGRDLPGLRLRAVRGLPVTVDAGTEARFVLEYAITDCAAVPSGVVPVPIRAQLWSGERTVDIIVPTLPGALGAGVRVDPPAQWQEALAATACGAGRR